MKVKHYIREALIVLIAASGLAGWYRRRAQRQGPVVRVLCFHDVTDAAWFADVVEFIHSTCTVLTPEAFVRGQFDTENINILLTFDDGYQSWVDTVVPVLAKANLKAMFFIASGLLDAAEAGEEAVAHFVRDRLKLTTVRQPLTWEGARSLVAAGHTIGGHTHNHVRLSAVTATEAKRELLTNKQSLESNLGVTLQQFAIPFGRSEDYTAGSLSLITQAGYTHVFGAETGWAEPADEVIKRTLITKGQSVAAIKRWVHGAYDIFSSLT